METGPEEVPENSDERAEALQDLTDKPLDEQGEGKKPNDDTSGEERSN